jgi:hypothetical protein
MFTRATTRAMFGGSEHRESACRPVGATHASPAVSCSREKLRIANDVTDTTEHV